MTRREPYLLVSDVDDTMLGDEEALSRFSAWLDDNRDWLRIAYASGRFVDSLLDSVNDEGLPAPDALIGGVGTEIMAYPTCDHFGGWVERMTESWSAATIRNILAEQNDLERQPEQFQSEFKISYFLYDAPAARLDELTTLLNSAGMQAKLVYSSQRDLDVLPVGVDKGSAAAFLSQRWEIPPERVIVSGNSANDSAMFLPQFRGVIVANAHDELKALAGPTAYLAGQSHAAGVQEGIEFWMSACGDPPVQPTASADSP